MKFFLSIFLITTLTSCATYNLNIYEGNGDLKVQHISKKVFVGTDAFVLDVVASSLVMVYELFVPSPVLSSSIGVNGGVTLRSYISQFTSLVYDLEYSTGDYNWVIIDGEDGKRHAYSGYKYTLERVK